MYGSTPLRGRWVGVTCATLLVLGVVACENPQPPASCGPLPQVSVNAGETTTVTACFNDPNGDMLTYSATSFESERGDGIDLGRQCFGPGGRTGQRVRYDHSDRPRGPAGPAELPGHGAEPGAAAPGHHPVGYGPRRSDGDHRCLFLLHRAGRRSAGLWRNLVRSRRGHGVGGGQYGDSHGGRQGDEQSDGHGHGPRRAHGYTDLPVHGSQPRPRTRWHDSGPDRRSG